MELDRAGKMTESLPEIILQLDREATAIPMAPGYAAAEDGRIISISSNWRGYGQREMAQHPNRDGSETA